MTNRSSITISGSGSYRFGYDREVASSAEKAVAFFVREEIRKRYPLSQQKRAAPGEWTYQAIADHIGVTKPQVHALLNRDDGSGFGPKFEEQFARKYFDGSIDRLRREAEKWWKENGSAFIMVTGDIAPKDAVAEYQKAVDFLEQVDELPKLRDFISHSKYSVAEVARVIEAYSHDETHPEAQSDGQPKGGWKAYFRMVLSGEAKRVLAGDVDGALLDERDQTPKKFQTAMKKKPRR